MVAKRECLSKVGFLRLLLVAAVLLLPAGRDVLPAGASANEKPVKHIILMIADGCGYRQYEATSLYLHGTPNRLGQAQFPLRLGVSTYCSTGSGYDGARAWSDFNYVKKGSTDSAAAATAMATGVKTYSGAIGVGPDKKPLKNVLERAEEVGRATGVVSSVQLSHATPAGFLAHADSRASYEEIARQALLQGKAEVIIGCGHPWYNNDGRRAEKANYQFVGGEETWKALEAGQAGADADGDGKADPWTLLETREAFRALATGDTPKRVVGVPQVSATLQQRRSGDAKAEPFAVPLLEDVPTLAELTRAALNVLDNDPDGFVLMVEGGAVDWAGHSNQSGRLIEEGVDFARAVDAVVAWVEKNSNWEETVLLVTADHETGYLTGPQSGPDALPMWKPLTNRGAGKQPEMQWNSGSHTNSLVPLFARGSAAQALRKQIAGHDPVRGAYIENTAIGQLIFDLLR